MNEEQRIFIICSIKIGLSKIKIAKYLKISKLTLYRYLQKNPISEQEINNIKIDEKILLNFYLSNYSQSEKIEHNEIKEEIQEEKENINDIKPNNQETMKERAKRAYKMLDELKKKQGIY